MTIAAIRPERFAFPYEGFTFSLGLHDGQHAWLSGHSGATWDDNAQKMAVSGGMAEQSAAMYAKIGSILAAADLGFGDVVHIIENVTMAGLESYPEAEDVRRMTFGPAEPALTTVIVDRLVRRAALIEVQVIASRGGGQTMQAGPSSGWHRSRVTSAGGLVSLPTILPVTSDGEIVAPGDLPGQYRWCLERGSKLLEAIGLSLADVVRTVDYSTPATRDRYSATHEPRSDLLGPVYPASAGILMSRLAQPGALVALDMIASREPAQPVNPGWDRYQTLSYSPAIRAGANLFMSGFAALDMQSQRALFAGDLAAQADHIYSTILELVRYAGGRDHDLVETIEYITPEGLPEYRAVADIRRRLLSTPWPASVGAVCRQLLRREFMLEVIPLAVLAQ